MASTCATKSGFSCSLPSSHVLMAVYGAGLPPRSAMRIAPHDVLALPHTYSTRSPQSVALLRSYASVMMTSKFNASASSIISKGPQPETRESPHTCCMDGRSHAGPRQSFQRKLCETVPPCRMTLMPMALISAPAAAGTGRSPTRPHAPGCRNT